MKTKAFKRIGLLGLSTLAAFTLMSNVKADNNCTTYKNYFYFNHAEGVSNYPLPEITDNYTKPYNTSTSYSFPMNSEIKSEGIICLTSDDGSKAQSITSNKGGNSCIDTWTLTEYYQTAPNSQGNGHTETYNGKTYTYYESENGNTKTRYYFHGKWYTTSDNGNDTDGDRPIPTNISDAVAAAIFPTNTVINRGNALDFSLSRTYVAADVSSGTPYHGWLWAPAVYYVEYEACTYRATINYYYEGTTERVEFKNTSNPNPFTAGDLGADYTRTVTSPEAANASCKPLTDEVEIAITREENGQTVTKDFTQDVFYRCSTFDANIHYCIEKEDGTCVPATDVDKDAKDYSKTGLNNGATDKVKSHTIKNCKLKKDSDKTVEYTIDNAPFEYTVRYVCGEETVNPKTGIALIIAAWTVGLGALGYSAYYFMNARKEENAEL